MSQPATIHILGAQYPTRLPSFGVREELVFAWAAYGPEGGIRAMRIYAAAVGLCSGIGALTRASLPALKYDLLEYGDAVYSWLREKGAEPKDIVEAAAPVLQAISAALFPREAEVTEAAGFSAGGVEVPTSPLFDSASGTAPAIPTGSSG